MKNIICYSLFGEKEYYWKGALENIELAKTLYPNFICRFYIDSNAKYNYLSMFIHRNDIEVVLQNNKGFFSGTLWRFLGSIDPEVNIFLSRDTDSRLSIREKLAVDEWLLSDKDFHIMRDHKDHTSKIMAGMWGCRNNILSDLNIQQKIDHVTDIDNRSCDEKFLDKYIYHRIKHTAFEHSEFGIKYQNNTHNFPSVRINDTDFVGKQYYD